MKGPRPKYRISQIVCLVTDKAKEERIVTGIFIRANSVTYELSCGPFTSTHYDFEIVSLVNVSNNQSVGFKTINNA